MIKIPYFCRVISWKYCDVEIYKINLGYSNTTSGYSNTTSGYSNTKHVGY